MAGAKLVVLCPSPRDVKAFERAYTQDHAPMVRLGPCKMRLGASVLEMAPRKTDAIPGPQRPLCAAEMRESVTARLGSRPGGGAETPRCPAHPD